MRGLPGRCVQDLQECEAETHEGQGHIKPEYETLYHQNMGNVEETVAIHTYVFRREHLGASTCPVVLLVSDSKCTSVTIVCARHRGDVGVSLPLACPDRGQRTSSLAWIFCDISGKITVRLVRVGYEATRKSTYGPSVFLPLFLPRGFLNDASGLLS